MQNSIYRSFSINYKIRFREIEVEIMKHSIFLIKIKNKKCPGPSTFTLWKKNM